MSQVIIPIGNEVRVVTSNLITWQTNYSGYTLFGPLISASDADLSGLGVSNRWLVTIQMRGDSANWEIRIAGSSALSGSEPSGHDLPADWETNDSNALIFSCDGIADDLLVPGPNYSGNQNLDQRETYLYRPPANVVTAAQAWITAFNSLTTTQKETATVIFDDGALPSASAPTISVAAPDVNEGGTSQIAATPTGGTYDGVTYEYEIVSGGGSINASGLITAPSVASDTTLTYRVRPTATGDGTVAADNTSDIGSWVQGTITVRDVPAPLPNADAPTIAVSAPSVNEGSTSQITATPSGGTYDSVSYAYEIVSGGGSVNSSGLITTPQVNSDTILTYRVRPTATGSGTNAENGTSDVGDWVQGTITVSDVVSPDMGSAITDTQITSTPSFDPDNTGINDTYGLGEIIEFTISYESAVDVIGTPRFPINLGQSPPGSPEYADYDSGTGSAEIVFLWTVSATDEDTNGIFFYGDTDSQNRGNIDLNGGTIRNAGTTISADLVTLNRGTKSSAKVDGSLTQLSDASAPTIVVSAPSVNEGNTSQITVAPSGGTYDSVSYTYEIVSGGGSVNSSGLITTPQVNSDTTLTYRVRPTATGDGTVAADNTSDIGSWVQGTITVRDVPAPLPNADAPTIAVSAPSVNEGSTSQITATPSGGTYDSVSYAYEIVSGGGSVNSSGLITTPQVNSDTILTYRVRPTATGSGTNAENGTSDVGDWVQGTITVSDVVSPDMGSAITDTQITSTPSFDPDNTGINDTYGLGEIIEFTISYESAVDVIGTPRFPINLGQSPPGSPEYADYDSGTGSAEIVFLWTVSATDEDTNGIFFYGDTDSQNRGNIDLNGGTIRNAGTTISADLVTLNRGTKSSAKVDGSLTQLSDASAPTIVVSAPSVNEGNTSQITVAPSGGTYDSVSYTYEIVSGGGSVNSSGLITTPQVNSDTTLTYRVRPTATGDGTVAADNTSDIGSWVQGTITVRDVPAPLPNADAPTIAVSAPSVNEGSTSQITATPSGGTYDSVSYAYEIVSGGGSVNSSGLITTPQVNSDTTLTYRVRPTATGDGTVAADNTSDIGSWVEGTITVRDVPAPLPNADAPTIAVSAPSVNEGNTSQITVAPSGGTYDSVSFAYEIVSGGGSVNSNGLITTPQVNSDTTLTYRVRPTATGDGTVAADNTSDIGTWVEGTITVRDVPADDTDYGEWMDIPNSGSSGVTAYDVTGLINDASQTFQIRVVTSDGTEGELSVERSATPLAVNRSPTWSTIPDQILNTDSEGTVDLNLYSIDLDGDPLTYDASSSNTNRATVSVSGSILTISSTGSAGSTIITVTAEDPGGLSASHPINVTVNATSQVIPIGLPTHSGSNYADWNLASGSRPQINSALVVGTNMAFISSISVDYGGGSPGFPENNVRFQLRLGTQTSSLDNSGIELLSSWENESAARPALKLQVGQYILNLPGPNHNSWSARDNTNWYSVLASTSNMLYTPIVEWLNNILALPQSQRDLIATFNW